MEKNVDRAIHSVLMKTGIVGYYKGVEQLILCVQYVIENFSSMTAVQNEIYPKVALQTNCEAHCIERNIRKIIQTIDTEELARVTGVKIVGKLTPKKLINLFVNYIRFTES